MQILPFSQQPTSAWAGGTTTELFLSPENASFKERNFDFRISTANIETEHSVFSDLSGYCRYLLVLDGMLQIRHEEHYEKKLYQFDYDIFDGSWKTESEGRVRDFNIMYRTGMDVSVNFRNCRTSFEIEKQNGHHFLFILDDFAPQIAGKKLQRYDLVVIEENIKLESDTKNAHFLEILIS
ncbi:MAG: hypothetical protein K0R65_835 [Crocinitomicaceae bacterium]|jgi:environmental stress-induced protein Ves|nr:hypothetical protein [Crocinitomicaceae bacterium]